MDVLVIFLKNITTHNSSTWQTENGIHIQEDFSLYKDKYLFIHAELHFE